MTNDQQNCSVTIWLIQDADIWFIGQLIIIKIVIDHLNCFISLLLDVQSVSGMQMEYWQGVQSFKR